MVAGTFIDSRTKYSREDKELLVGRKFFLVPGAERLLSASHSRNL